MATGCGTCASPKGRGVSPMDMPYSPKRDPSEVRNRDIAAEREAITEKFQDYKPGCGDSASAALIIDAGSGLIKAGFSSDNYPRFTAPNITGVLNKGDAKCSFNNPEFLYMDDAYRSSEMYSFRTPVVRGHVSNWTDMETMYEEVYDRLKLCEDAKRNYPVLLTSQPKEMKAEREKLVEMFMENFECSGLFIAMPAVLSLFSAGRTTGLVLESGYGVTHTVPVYDGYMISRSINRIDVGGSDVTNMFIRESRHAPDFSFSSFAQREAMNLAKEKICYVALNYEQEKCSMSECALKKLIEIPLGKFKTKNPCTTTVEVSTGRFEVPEALFKPQLLMENQMSIQAAIKDTIRRSDPALQKHFYSSIVLAGGNTMFPNIGERLKKELTTCQTSSMNIDVIARRERYIGAWIGGAVLGSMSTFKDMWITPQEYKEYGPQIVNRKCF